MAGRPSKPLFPNPFYVVLLVSSTAFVVTALGYLVSPWVGQKAGQGAGPGSRALAAWFDRRGPLALVVEFAAMLVFGLLAIATDHWFTPKAARGPRGPE